MPKHMRKHGARGRPSASALLELRNTGGDTGEAALERAQAFQRVILAIPPGRVSTYGKIAEAAGYPRCHRLVARLLGEEGFDDLPWHRVVGADGALKVAGASANEQRARLRLEGVRLKKGKVDLGAYLHRWPADVEYSARRASST